MSNLAILPQTPANQLELPLEKSKADFNRYLFLDPSHDIPNEKMKKIVYKTLAIASMILFGAAVVGGIVALVHFAPILTPFFLVLAIAVYKRFHNHVVLPLKQASEQSQENIGRCQEMAQEIKNIQGSYQGYTSYHNLLKKIGIDSNCIPVEDLSQANENSSYLLDLAPLIGRVNYWAKTERDILDKIEDLDRQIIPIYQTLETRNDSDLEIEKTQLKMQKQRLEELQLLPAKIAGAYALHVLSDIADKRDFDEFGSCHPMSYFSHIEYQAERKPQPYYYFPQSSDKKSITKEEMMRSSPLVLSQRIFGDSKTFIM